MAKHEILVEGIGSVGSTASWKEARETYSAYVRGSKEGAGSVTGESVTWMRDGAIYREYLGTKEEE